MDFDFRPYFNKYEALVSKSDDAFEHVRKAYAECVKCEEKCADCCYALFDLTLIEALYINHKFNEKNKSAEKAELLEKANRADRLVHKIKQKAHRDFQAGKSDFDPWHGGSGVESGGVGGGVRGGGESLVAWPSWP